MNSLDTDTFVSIVNVLSLAKFGGREMDNTGKII
jgi:hypothetical protein